MFGTRSDNMAEKNSYLSFNKDSQKSFALFTQICGVITLYFPRKNFLELLHNFQWSICITPTDLKGIRIKPSRHEQMAWSNTGVMENVRIGKWKHGEIISPVLSHTGAERERVKKSELLSCTVVISYCTSMATESKLASKCCFCPCS